MELVFLGDVHGKFKSLNSFIANNSQSTIIQVGDLGVFTNQDKELVNTISKAYPNFHFIRGNHDSPELVKKCPSYLQDGLNEFKDNNSSVFSIGGAWSIDRQWRTEGLDWWSEEESSEEDFEKLYKQYKEAKPEIVVSHDAPYSITSLAFSSHPIIGRSPINKTRTSSWLDTFLFVHKPKLWVFGHWHYPLPELKLAFDTRFVCLPELVPLKVNTDEYFGKSSRTLS